MAQGEEEEVEERRRRQWETHASTKWGSRGIGGGKRTRYVEGGWREWGVPRGRLKVAEGPHTRLGHAHTHDSHTVPAAQACARGKRREKRPGSARARCNVGVRVCVWVCA